MAMRSVIVTDEGVNVVSYNEKRVALIIFNVGGNSCELYDSPEMELGLPFPSGATLTLKKVDEDPVEEAIWAKTSAGLTTELRVWEIYKKG